MLSARTDARQRKWSTSPTMPGTHALSIGAPSASRWVALRVVVLMRLCLQLPLACSPFCAHHLQIPVRHARAGVGPGIASQNDLGAAGGDHHDPSEDPSFMHKFIGLVDDEHRKGHFPEVWDPHRSRKACLLSPNKGSTSSPVTSTVPPLPDIHTISGLQQALKMLGYRIAVDGDYGAETRRVVMSFQMRTGIVADGIAGAQTEAKLLSELTSVGGTDTHRSKPVAPRLYRRCRRPKPSQLFLGLVPWRERRFVGGQLFSWRLAISRHASLARATRDTSRCARRTSASVSSLAGIRTRVVS